MLTQFSKKLFSKTWITTVIGLVLPEGITGITGTAAPDKPGTPTGGIPPGAADTGNTWIAADDSPGAPGITGNTEIAPGKVEPRILFDNGIMSTGSAGGTGFFSRARYTKCMAFTLQTRTAQDQLNIFKILKIRCFHIWKSTNNQIIMEMQTISPEPLAILS